MIRPDQYELIHLRSERGTCNPLRPKIFSQEYINKGSSIHPEYDRIDHLLTGLYFTYYTTKDTFFVFGPIGVPPVNLTKVGMYREKSFTSRIW